MTRRPGHGPRALATVLPEVARKSLRKGGATLARLIAEWPTIIGPKLADHCIPRRLTDRDGDGATLILGVHGPMAIELQHLEPVLIDRVNSHLGYAAIRRVRLVQDGPHPPAAKTALRPAPAAPLEAAVPDLETIEDEDLRAALLRLADAVSHRPGPR